LKLSSQIQPNLRVQAAASLFFPLLLWFAHVCLQSDAIISADFSRINREPRISVARGDRLFARSWWAHLAANCCQRQSLACKLANCSTGPTEQTVCAGKRLETSRKATPSPRLLRVAQRVWLAQFAWRPARPELRCAGERQRKAIDQFPKQYRSCGRAGPFASGSISINN